MTDLDRAALIELLDRLGSSRRRRRCWRRPARCIARRPNPACPGTTSSGSDDDEPAADEAEARRWRHPARMPDETARLIDRLLRKGVSEDLREDLTEMKRQLAEGSLDQEDRRYVRALAKRLGV